MDISKFQKKLFCFTFILSTLFFNFCQSQGPTTDPINSKCIPTSYCVLSSANCNSTQYCDPYGGLFCNSTCTKKLANGLPCSSYTQCISGVCSGTCVNNTSTTVTPTQTYQYETQTCDLVSNLCYGSLSCSQGNLCIKKYSVAQGGNCRSSDQCSIGLVCANSLCQMANGSGMACTADLNCSSLAPTGSNAACFCSGPFASSGNCGYFDSYVVNLNLVSKCQPFVTTYLNLGTIGPTNTGYNEYLCILSCQYSGSNTLFQNWQGKNHIENLVPTYAVAGCAVNNITPCGSTTTSNSGTSTSNSGTTNSNSGTTSSNQKASSAMNLFISNIMILISLFIIAF